MRIFLLIAFLFSLAFSQRTMLKDGNISRYEEANGDDKVRVYRIPKTDRNFTNEHPIIPNDSPTYKGRTNQEMFDMGVTNLTQMYMQGWKLVSSYPTTFGGTILLIFERD